MLLICAPVALRPAGRQVSRTQVVRGIMFNYSPPPRRRVPYAASIASVPPVR